MKRFILPLLLLLTVGLLIAAESQQSDVVGYVKYDCVAGFNYVAVPMGAGGNAEELVAGMTDVSAIYKFDPASQGWTSIEYDSEFGEWTDTMPVIAGDVMLLDCAAPTSFYSLGELPEVYAYDINAGFNYICLPVNRADLTAAELVGDEIGNIGSIFRWSNATQGWESIDYDSEFGEWTDTMPIGIGDIILLDSSDVTTWPSRHSITTIQLKARK